MAFTIEDFVNDEVLNATNPHPDYGYFHGKQQPKGVYLWDPPRPITASINANAPNDPEKLSGINPGVCVIAVNGSQQCGTIAGTQPTVCCVYTQHTLTTGLIESLQLRRHMREAHPGASMC